MCPIFKKKQKTGYSTKQYTPGMTTPAGSTKQKIWGTFFYTLEPVHKCRVQLLFCNLQDADKKTNEGVKFFIMQQCRHRTRHWCTDNAPIYRVPEEMSPNCRIYNWMTW